jgi:peptidoglycan/xylan/chitin deacetylase (PgdA/CDA1 family)
MIVDSQGTVVISVDAELGWGYHDHESLPSWLDAARAGWLELVDLCDAYEIPTTWAFVGHLLLEDCDGRHSDHPLSPEWFARERGAWADRPDLRFGPDLVTAVRDADVKHELACHTFSHVPFGNPDVPRPVAEAEIETCLRLAAERDISLSSFVFPRNAVGHRDVLADYGFECYRGKRPDAGSNLPLERQLSKLVGGVTRPAVPPLVDATIDEYGLVDVPASLYLFNFEGIGRRFVETIRDDFVVRSVRRGLDAVAGTDRILHLWLHPNNLRTDSDVDRLQRVFEAIRERSDAGDVNVETMGEVAERVRLQQNIEA